MALRMRSLLRINRRSFSEHAFDPKFDNLIHGVWTRQNYEQRQGRQESEIGTLGRLFVYQMNCCPFCGKVKAVLDFYNLKYSLIEVSPVTKKQLPKIQKFLHDGSVPILLAAKAQTGPNKFSLDQKLIYQSNVIIATLFDYLCVSGLMPQREFDRSRSSIIDAWLQWIDNNLIPHCYTAIDADKSNRDAMFDYLSEFKKFETMSVTTFPIKQMSSQLFHNQAVQLRAKYGIPTGAEYDHLREALAEWHAVTKISFHGGSKPDLADLACFGVLRTFAPNMPFMEQMIVETGLEEWYASMTELVGKHSCVTHA